MGVQVRVLGGFSVSRDSQEIPASAFGGRLPRKLVRVLLTRHGEHVPTDLIVEALWPRRPPADPPANVKVLVNRARRALGDPGLIVTGVRGYSVPAGDACVVDAEVFQAMVADARAHLDGGRPGPALREFRRALAVWGGDPLPEDTYEDWARPWREALSNAHVETLEGAAVAALHVDDPEAVSLATTAVSAQPLRERANLLLVRAHAARGDRAAAIAAFSAFRHRLADELGLDPSPEAAALHQRLLRAEPLESPIPKPVPVPVVTRQDELPFVGREREVTQIEAALGPEGPGVVVVAGASGAGKSRLLAESALRSRFPVLAVRAFPAARTEPWSLARALLTEALGLDVAAVRAVPDRAVAALADIVPEIAEHAPASAHQPSLAESRRALLVEGAVRLVERATGPGALLVVDDLQWADPSSLKLLALIHGRVPGLGLLAAYRPEEVEDAGPAARFLRELWRGGSSPLAVDIGPLGEDGVHQLVADRALAAVLSDWTDRTPLVIGEVLQCLAQQGAVYRDARGRWRPANAEAITFAEAAAREGQARLVLDRTRRLTRPQATLLSLLALAGREVPPAVLGRAVGVLPLQVLDDLQVLGHLGLARLAEHGWATRHDFVAETLAADQSREERGRLHAMLADALGPDAADEAEVAGHLAAAGDAEAAATVFARAASEHLQRFADQEAWALAERGLSLTTRPETRALLLEARAEARGRRGELAGARTDLREALVNQRDHVVRARILTRTAALALGADDLQRGSDQAELALVEAGDDPAQRAAALVVCAVADMNLRREDRATDRYGEASRIFERLSDTRGLAEVVGAQAMSAFMAGDLRRAADEFQRAARLLEDTGDLLSALTPWSTRGHALCFLGNPEAALAAADASLEMARTLGSPDGQAMVLAHRAEALCGLGRVDEALADAAEGVRLAEDAGHRAWTSLALRARGIAQFAARDLPGAEESFRAALRVSPVPTLVGWASARLAMVLVAGGQLEKATHHVQVALADTPPVVHYEARLAEAELAAARHDPDAATAARDALGLARAGGHLASVPRLEELVAGDPAS